MRHDLCTVFSDIGWKIGNKWFSTLPSISFVLLKRTVDFPEDVAKEFQGDLLIFHHQWESITM
jgi:hypothetical protein